MQHQHFTTTIFVEQTAKEAFNVVKNVRSWWSGLYAEEFEGRFDKLNDEFTFRAGGGAHYTKQKLIELTPPKRIVWLVTESKLSFVEKETEWTGTKLSFDISTENHKTKIVFTHEGLVPAFECYEACAPAWTQYIRERLVLALEASSKAEPVNK